MTTRSIVALAGVSLALTLTGCTETGNPKPGATGETTPTTSSSASTSSSNDLAQVDPCQLVNEADRTQLGLTSPGKPETLAGSPACVWTASAQFTFRIDWDADLGVKDLNYQGNTPTPMSAGRHAASKLSGGVNGGGRDNGVCQVFIAVTDSSSASITYTNAGATNSALACERAELVAKLIDPKLP